jgi:segregation and condensation protein A
MAVESAAGTDHLGDVQPGATEIRFVDAPRPESGTHVRLERFDGPLALLLALIEQRQLDVLTVPLGELASAYLSALAALPTDRMGHISAFVRVAAQLILIKSRAMLPTAPVPDAAAEDAPDPEAELRERLILYRAYRDGGAWLAARLASGDGLFHREAAVASAAATQNARPADEPVLDPALLAEALGRSIQLVPPPPPAPELVARAVTLAERAAAIREALRGAPQVVLQELLSEATDRVLIAVTFLAMLELVKRRELAIEQDEPWGPIRCRLTTAEERAAAGLPPADAEVPLDESLSGFA